MSEVEIFGEPVRIMRGMRLRDKITENGYIWFGGPCREDATLDITTEVPSESKEKLVSYNIHFKIYPDPDYGDILKIEQIHPCYCDDKRYTNGVSRFTLPCKHEIAGRMAIERDLKWILKQLYNKGKIEKRILEMSYERKYIEQEDPNLWYVRYNYPREIFEIKRKIDTEAKKDKNFFTAMMINSLLYWNLALSLGKDDLEFFSEEDLFYPKPERVRLIQRNRRPFHRLKSY